MQRYNWTGTLNTRDLGGTPSTNGGYVKYQRFIRSDAPNAISDDIKDFLVDGDITTIIDLRNENIVKRAPNGFWQDDRFQCYNFPLSINAKVPNSENDVIENYCCMLENETAIANIFKTMANSKGGVLFHCQEGKDRTGLIAAIILLLAEVSDIDIFADYEISNVYLYEMIKIAKIIPNGMPDFLLYVRSEYMEKILAYLRKKYETVENYLLTKGISSAEISNLKGKLMS